MRIGLIALSGKPVTKGHFHLIKIASRECDRVTVFVSVSDRKRKDEFPVYGSMMKAIWRDFIEQSLPSNVKVTYGGSPISNVWTTLGNANEENGDDVHVIYSDPTDLEANFPPQSLEKYAKDLYSRGLIVLEPIHRSETDNVSGTEMRRALQSKDKRAFFDGLPDELALHREQIWKMLSTAS